eukprot:XP_001698365.1 predicted protein [Chlamydomonas reinhardtii]
MASQPSITAEQIDALMDVLANSINRETATSLLRSTGGSVEAAVAAHFAGGASAGAGAQGADVGPSGSGAGAADPLSSLRSMLGATPTDSQLRELLRIAVRPEGEPRMALYVSDEAFIKEALAAYPTATGLRCGPRGPPKTHVRLLATPRGCALERLLPLYAREPTLLSHLVHASRGPLVLANVKLQGPGLDEAAGGVVLKADPQQQQLNGWAAPGAAAAAAAGGKQQAGGGPKRYTLHLQFFVDEAVIQAAAPPAHVKDGSVHGEAQRKHGRGLFGASGSAPPSRSPSAGPEDNGAEEEDEPFTDLEALLDSIQPPPELPQVHRLAPAYVSADFFPAPVGGTCGGFLCDEMGLGKSLQTIMLIVSNPPPPDWTHTPVSVRERLQHHYFRAAPGPLSALMDDPHGDPAAIKTTLLVTPANLQGYKDSTAGMGAALPSGLLPPAMAHGDNGFLVPVHQCDVVLVSYEVLRKELTLAGSSKAATRLLPRLGFWRIVLDEAQLVANSNSVAAEVVSSLYRRHAWVVTGTPISANVNEVQSLCEFLSYEPYYHGPVALLRGVMLRRSKAAVESQLALPPCLTEDLVVELSGVERAFYDVLKSMRQIMARLVSEAYSAYDQVVANLYSARLLVAALQDSSGKAEELTPEAVADGGATATDDATEDAASTGGGALAALVTQLQQTCKLVSTTDLLFQVKARGSDGSILWEHTGQTAAFGGAVGGTASVAPVLAEEQARDRKRRWQRLVLDALTLRSYLACLQAVEAHEKAVVAAEKLQHRKDLHAAAVEAAAVAKAQLDSAAEAGMDPSSLGGGGAAGAEAAGSQQPAAAANGGRASKRQRTNARGGGKGKGKDGEPAAALSLQEECVRLADRVKVMARCEQEAEEALESAKTGVEETLYRAEPVVRDFQKAMSRRGGTAASRLSAAEGDVKRGVGASAAEAREEAPPCPICLDVPDRRTITTCGHTFCTDCIHDIVQGKGSAPCPICRAPLQRADLMDSVPEEEAAPDPAELEALRMVAARAARDGRQGDNAEYGAKVAALLAELGRMGDEEPDSKALVFSSWGRLLRLVHEALVANGITCVSLVGGNPEARQAALQTFLHDRKCRVLLLMKSTSGGAAGLTLTVAHTAFMLEPALNPGLEAQAAARICRLGQDWPTRVVRIIAKDTVEERCVPPCGECRSGGCGCCC